MGWCENICCVCNNKKKWTWKIKNSTNSVSRSKKIFLIRLIFILSKKKKYISRSYNNRFVYLSVSSEINAERMKILRIIIRCSNSRSKWRFQVLWTTCEPNIRWKYSNKIKRNRVNMQRTSYQRTSPLSLSLFPSLIPYVPPSSDPG